MPSRSLRRADRTSVRALVLFGIVVGVGVVDDEGAGPDIEEDGARGAAGIEAGLFGPGFLDEDDEDEDECKFSLLVLLVVFRSREAKRRSSSSRSPASEQKVI